MSYVALLRGINVGGKNKVPMAQLRTCLADCGFTNVRTYIQSGNVLLDSPLSAREVGEVIEAALPKAFSLDSDLVRALVLSGDDYAEVLAHAPDGFGSQPDQFHYDVAFYLDIGPDDVMPHVALHPDVDTAVAGDRALYYSRVSALRTKSRLSRIASSPVYRSLTIRNWRTVTTLARMLAD